MIFRLNRMDSATAQRRMARLLEDIGDTAPIIVTDPRTGRQTIDSNTSAIMYRQLLYIEKEMYKVEYPDLKARTVLPVDNQVPSGAAAFMYRMYDRLGEAKLISDWSMDFPNVEITGQEFVSKVLHYGDSYAYSTQELREASMAGLPLQSEKADAAREAIEQKLDLVAATGDATNGVLGVANNPHVPVVTTLTGGWGVEAETTGETIVADVRKFVAAVFTASPKNTEIDTLLVTPEFYAEMQKPLNAYNQDVTAMSTILAKTSIKSIVYWNKLRTAGAGGTPRMIGMVKDPKVARLVIPQEFETAPIFVKNFTFSQACHLSTGGVVIKQPLSMAYADNLLVAA